MLYEKDSKSMFRYRKYIKVKRQFECFLGEIKHREKYQNSFWKTDLQNKISSLIVPDYNGFC